MGFKIWRVYVCILNWLTGVYHHSVADIDPDVAGSRGVICALEEDKISRSGMVSCADMIFLVLLFNNDPPFLLKIFIQTA